LNGRALLGDSPPDAVAIEGRERRATHSYGIADWRGGLSLKNTYLLALLWRTREHGTAKVVVAAHELAPVHEEGAIRRETSDD